MHFKYRFAMSQIVTHEVLYLRFGLLMGHGSGNIFNGALNSLIVDRGQSCLDFAVAAKEIENYNFESLARDGSSFK